MIDYVKSCTACAQAKTPHHRPYGLLKKLPIPNKPWNSISMDFIEQLPPSLGFTAILVIIDQLSKQAIFIPTHDTITSPTLAKLFLLHVFSKHGVPSHVTSDRGTEFVSHFFRSLGKALDMQLHFTSGYHPEGDGQTKHSNQTLEQYLRIYCNYQQDNWLELLPLAEFAYNNAPSATTGVSPFFANKGYHPNITVYPKCDMTSKKAQEYAVDLESLHLFLREEMSHAQKRYQVHADAKWIPAPNFKVDDLVYVKAKYFRST
jgi:Integrase core domain